MSLVDEDFANCHKCTASATLYLPRKSVSSSPWQALTDGLLKTWHKSKTQPCSVCILLKFFGLDFRILTRFTRTKNGKHRLKVRFLSSTDTPRNLRRSQFDRKYHVVFVVTFGNFFYFEIIPQSQWWPNAACDSCRTFIKSSRIRRCLLAGTIQSWSTKMLSPTWSMISFDWKGSHFIDRQPLYFSDFILEDVAKQENVRL